jgi:hypothetical protein
VRRSNTIIGPPQRGQVHRERPESGFGSDPLAGAVGVYFDLELVPIVVDKPREIQLVVNPGFLWRLRHGFAVGSRVGFLVNSDQTKTAQFGITPLVVKSWPIKHSFFNAYFVEGDFIFRFNRPVNGPATNPFIFNVVLGLSF